MLMTIIKIPSPARDLQHWSEGPTVEKLPQTDVEARKIRVQFPAENVLPASRHQVVTEGLGAEGRERPVDRETPSSGSRRRNQSDQQVESDSQRSSSHSTKIRGPALFD